MDTLVSTGWLAAHLEDPDLVVLDCSVRTEIDQTGGFRNFSGRADYLRRHIPGAGFADLTAALCDTAAGIEFALPTPDAFCKAMGALGVGDYSRVVLYDSSLSAWAARVWWMLRWVGFDDAAVLDGGLKLWRAEGRLVSDSPVVRAPARLTPALRPQLIADRDEMRSAIGDASVQIVDTLPAASYRGDLAMYDRPGHIPGAVNVCGLDLLDETGRFRPEEELAAMHDGPRDRRWITYCGGGILASANAFVMTRLGFEDVGVYTASLQEWAADPENPMETGAGN